MKKTMSSPRYDVIIVGAGPAGSTAAYTLGQAGLRALILEKERLPRYKPCGGGLSAALLSQFPFSFEPVIESHVTAIRYTLGRHEVTVPLPPDQVHMVMRDTFDYYILQQARAEVRQGAAVRRVMDRYGIALDRGPLHGHPLPIYTGRQQIATHRVLLVGDAAGLVDPLTGEGIRFAVQSGRLAATALAAGQPETYQKSVRRQIGRSHAAGLALAWLFYHFPHACYELGVHNPLATRAFVDLLSGRTTYPRLFASLFGTLPLFLATEAVAGLVAATGRPDWQQQVRTAIYGAGQV